VIAIEVDVEELAHAGDAPNPLPGEGGKLGGSAADRERRQGADAVDRAACKGRVKGIGDDVEVGQLRHGGRLYPRESAC
jgi:hypothetical protein